MPLLQYCKENNLVYTTIARRMSKWETADEAIQYRYKYTNSKNNACKYFIEWEKLWDYCKRTGKKYDSLRKKMWRENRINK